MACDVSAGDETATLSISKVLTLENEIVSVCYADEFLLAGSEDGILILWKGDTVEVGKQISTLSLGPGEAVSHICSSSKNQWLVGCGTQVFSVAYKSPELVSTHEIDVGDEVNNISVNDKLTHAAITDDNGYVTLINMATKKPLKRLLGHENICSCVKFRPKCPKSMVSGGLDCMLVLWDYKAGKVLGSVNMAEVSSKDQTEQKDSYVVNPPLIHCLDITVDGLVAAAGLENGKIMLFTIGGKSLKLASTVDAHKQGVSGICINADMTMVSVGNDSQVHVWKLSTARAPGKTLVWATQVQTFVHSGKPSCIAVMRSQKQIVIAEETTKITIYDQTSS